VLPPVALPRDFDSTRTTSASATKRGKSFTIELGGEPRDRVALRARPCALRHALAQPHRRAS
jgi:hypothetical protein